MDKNTPKWKKFEKLVATVQQSLAPHAEVRLNDKLQGHKSQTPRQVDISIRQKVAQYDLLIVIECKDLSVPVDVKDLESFIGIVEDIRANKAVMVSASGYSGAALKRGQESGLQLLRLVDTGDHDWKAYISLPTIFTIKRLELFSFEFAMPDSIKNIIPNVAKPEDLKLFDKGGKELGTLHTILMRKWNEGAIPQTVGENTKIPYVEKPHFVELNGVLSKVEITTTYIVSVEYRHMNWAIDEISGFYDEITKTISTNSMQMATIDTTKIIEMSRKIDNVERLAIKPTIDMGIRQRFTIPGDPLWG